MSWQVVDSTGAGDFFAGGFLSAWLRRESLSCGDRVGHLETDSVDLAVLVIVTLQTTDEHSHDMPRFLCASRLLVLALYAGALSMSFCQTSTAGSSRSSTLVWEPPCFCIRRDTPQDCWRKVDTGRFIVSCLASFRGPSPNVLLGGLQRPRQLGMDSWVVSPAYPNYG